MVVLKTKKIILKIASHFPFLLFFPFYISLFLLNGCAQVKYLAYQGIGQLEIQNRAIPNERVLADSQYPQSIKDRIGLITQAKDFFYSYFNKKKMPFIRKQRFWIERRLVT